MNKLNKIKKYLLVAALAGAMPLPLLAASLRINEIMYDLAGSDTAREWVELFNPGPEEVTIVGGSGPGSWRFIDSYGSHLLAKEAARDSLAIPPGGFIILAADAPTFLREHQNFEGAVVDTTMSLRNTCDTIRIKNGYGQIIDEAFYASNIGAAGNGRALEFDGKYWRESLRDGGSPGVSNSVEGVLLPPAPTPMVSTCLSPSPSPVFVSPSTAPVPQPSSSIPSTTPNPTAPPSPSTGGSIQDTAFPIISEFIPNPVGNDAENEWVELANEFGVPLNLAGWMLETASGKKRVELKGVIPTAGFLVLERPEYKFTLRNTGDELRLLAPSGEQFFVIRYDNEIPEGASAARFGENIWHITKKPTPGAPNVLGEEITLPEAETASLPQPLPVIKEGAGPDSPSLAQGHGGKNRSGSFGVTIILGIGFITGLFAALIAILMKRRF